ncbi:MAG: hypothetical protein FWG45_07840, partial [Oscillospiraceae bacterium]|nr:hypothetical protein [Oscillospiraceae bacterium]
DPNLHPQLRDGRWRPEIFDFEFGYGLWNRGDPTPSATAAGANTLHAIINRTGTTTPVPGAGANAHHFNATESASFMIPALLQRADMRAKLANAFMDIMSASHNPTFANGVYKGLRDQIRTEHGFVLGAGYISALARNGTNAAGPGWPATLEDAESDSSSQPADQFITARGATVATMISTAHPSGLSQSGGGTATTLTINGDGGSAQMNTRPIGLSEVNAYLPNDPRRVKSATVNYYGGVDIPMVFNPWPGWEIDKVTVGGTDTPVQEEFGKFFIKVQAGAKVEVSFKKEADMIPFISSVQAKRQNWFELTNYSDKTVSTRGLFLSDNYNSTEDDETARRPHDAKFRMPALIIRPGQTVRFALRASDVSTMKWNKANFSLSLGERFRMADSKGNIVQHIEVTQMSESDMQTRGQDGYWTIKTSPLPPPPKFCAHGVNKNEWCKECYPPCEHNNDPRVCMQCVCIHNNPAKTCPVCLNSTPGVTGTITGQEGSPRPHVLTGRIQNTGSVGYGGWGGDGAQEVWTVVFELPSVDEIYPNVSGTDGGMNGLNVQVDGKYLILTSSPGGQHYSPHPLAAGASVNINIRLQW